MSDKYLPELTRGYDRLTSSKNNIFAYNVGVRETTTQANIFTLESAGGSWGIVDDRSGLLKIFPSLDSQVKFILPKDKDTPPTSRAGKLAGGVDRTLENLTKQEGADTVKNSVGNLKKQKNTSALWKTLYEKDPSKQVTANINKRTLEGIKIGSNTLFRLA